MRRIALVDRPSQKNKLMLDAGEDMEDARPLDMKSVNGNEGENSMENNQTIVGGKKKNNENINLVVNKLSEKITNRPMSMNKLPFCITRKPYAEKFYNEYLLRKYILSKVRKKLKPMDLDYNPEEGHWILLEQPGSIHDVVFYNSIDRMEPALPLAKENVIEPSYVILDSERQEDPDEELKSKEKLNDYLTNHDSNRHESKILVKTVVMDSLKVEVSRRLNPTDMKDMEADLAADMEHVANAVYLAIQHDKEHSRVSGNHIIEAISLAVQNTSYLKRVLPIGLVVGSTLAALRNFFDVHDNNDNRALDANQDFINGVNPKGQLTQEEAIKLPVDRINHYPLLEKKSRKEEESATLSAPNQDDGVKGESKTLKRDTIMVGAVTAALGASALLTSQQEGYTGSYHTETSPSSSGKKHMKIKAARLEEVVDDKQHSNIVTSLAEKAMSVAAPVVPTKGDGEVDQDRLVAMLAELGQRGGMLRLVAKLALLWGGLRGAMSLTDRLISFLRIADRPLLQRVLGFVCMVLVLWSPLLVPLLPTLLHNWATHNSSRIAELACIVGLYTAITTLIMQWGKRIRGYDYPLKKYGLDLKSSGKIQNFLTGLAGGVLLVLAIHSVNALLGFVNLSWPSNLTSSSLDLTAKIKAYGQLFLLAGQGLLTAAGIAFVEELLFRAWLLEEIAADLGYHPGIILSGLAFSLSQRSLQAIPGLWLLSLCLAGIRLRKQGSLFIPIGLRTGIMASSYILQMGGFLIYKPKFHHWVVGIHPFQPFSGVLGLSFALLLALVLYPRHPGLREKIPRTIRA